MKSFDPNNPKHELHSHYESVTDGVRTEVTVWTDNTGTRKVGWSSEYEARPGLRVTLECEHPGSSPAPIRTFIALPYVRGDSGRSVTWTTDAFSADGRGRHDSHPVNYATRRVFLDPDDRSRRNRRATAIVAGSPVLEELEAAGELRSWWNLRCGAGCGLTVELRGEDLVAILDHAVKVAAMLGRAEIRIPFAWLSGRTGELAAVARRTHLTDELVAQILR
ncbi:MAG: hypothetical protein M3Y77_02325 [Actinomycetota bacterium]|nr:hypothetical protein [Actinomycetota bacterium]